MSQLLNPRFRSLGLALLACAITSCSGADFFEGEQVPTLAAQPAAMYVKSHDALARSTLGEATQSHIGGGSGTPLLAGVGSVW